MRFCGGRIPHCLCRVLRRLSVVVSLLVPRIRPAAGRVAKIHGKTTRRTIPIPDSVTRIPVLRFGRQSGSSFRRVGCGCKLGIFAYCRVAGFFDLCQKYSPLPMKPLLSLLLALFGAVCCLGAQLSTDTLPSPATIDSLQARIDRLERRADRWIAFPPARVFGLCSVGIRIRRKYLEFPDPPRPVCTGRLSFTVTSLQRAAGVRLAADSRCLSRLSPAAGPEPAGRGVQGSLLDREYGLSADEDRVHPLSDGAVAADGIRRLVRALLHGPRHGPRSPRLLPSARRLQSAALRRGCAQRRGDQHVGPQQFEGFRRAPFGASGAGTDAQRFLLLGRIRPRLPPPRPLRRRRMLRPRGRGRAQRVDRRGDRCRRG